MNPILRVLTILALTACGSSSSDNPDGGRVDGDGTPIPDDGGIVLDDGGNPVNCTDERGICLDYQTRRSCEGGTWTEETCASGSGCFQGECALGQCSDECDLGTSNGAQNCELYDIASGTFPTENPNASMHDRARSFNQWLRRDSLAYGGVSSARYSDPPNYTQVDYKLGLGDSAIWTGTYLAAEALRLQATGALDARQNVADIIDTLHLWFNVSGDPGVLARFVAPSNAPAVPALGDLDCNDLISHCGVSYEGELYDYIGHISRDQFQGAIFGYSMAYDSLGPNDEPARELIREDIVELVEELMKERTVPVHITYNGDDLGVHNITMRFVVLLTNEMDNGAVSMIIDTDDTDNSQLYGFQEFIPNIAQMLRQLPLLGFLPDIPRPGSAIMLSSVFRVALQVTKDVPAYAARRAAILDYYENASTEGGNINDWLSIADDWEYHGECGASYYANNIVMEPLHNLARLETDPTRATKIRDEILGEQMWTEFENDKNVFFSYSYSSNTPSAAASIVSEANAQLSGFPAPPRIRVPVDLRNDPRYTPHEGGCPNQTSHNNAVDVADRVVSDFMWQRNPWDLLNAGFTPATSPGVDYLLAYWLGRHHQYLQDDNAGSCLIWR